MWRASVAARLLHSRQVVGQPAAGVSRTSASKPSLKGERVAAERGDSAVRVLSNRTSTLPGQTTCARMLDDRHDPAGHVAAVVGVETNRKGAGTLAAMGWSRAGTARRARLVVERRGAGALQ